MSDFPFDIPTVQPSSGAFVGHRNFLTSTSGAFQRPIKFAGVDYDTNSMYNTSTGTITIPSSGKWCFSFQWVLEQNSGTQNGLIQPVLYNTTPGINSNNLLSVADFITQVKLGTNQIQCNTGNVILQCNVGENFIWSSEREVQSFLILAANAGTGRAGNRSYIETHKIA